MNKYEYIFIGILIGAALTLVSLWAYQKAIEDCRYSTDFENCLFDASNF